MLLQALPWQQQNSVIDKANNQTDTKHVSHTHSYDFTESQRLFPLQSTNNKVIYLYMNTRIKYKRHVFYLKHCLGLAILGNCALPSNDLIFIILHWRQSHLSFFSSQSPFIFFLCFCIFPLSCSVAECWWAENGTKPQTVSFRLKVQLWKVQLFPFWSSQRSGIFGIVQLYKDQLNTSLAVFL